MKKICLSVVLVMMMAAVLIGCQSNENLKSKTQETADVSGSEIESIIEEQKNEIDEIAKYVGSAHMDEEELKAYSKTLCLKDSASTYIFDEDGKGYPEDTGIEDIASRSWFQEGLINEEPTIGASFLDSYTAKMTYTITSRIENVNGKNGFIYTEIYFDSIESILENVDLNTVKSASLIDIDSDTVIASSNLEMISIQYTDNIVFNNISEKIEAAESVSLVTSTDSRKKCAVTLKSIEGTNWVLAVVAY